MKRSEFKKLIKPIVAECIRESLAEGGLISGVISEVVKGMAPAASSAARPKAAPPNPVVERLQKNAFSKEQSEQLRTTKAKLMAAVGDTYNGVNLFEGTTPTSAQTSPQQQARPLSGQDGADPGVDISSLFGTVGRKWNAHMADVKEEK